MAARRTVMAAVPGALLAAALSACSPFGGGASAPPRPTISASPAPAASPSPTGPARPLAVWVLYPLGIHVRSSPDVNANNVVATEEQGVELDVQGGQDVAGKTWYQVVSHNAAQDRGWILADPTLVIAIDVSMHIDTSAGYSLLYPASWSIGGSNPATFAGPASDPRSMTVQVAPQDSGLARTPINPGTEANDQDVEVYGQTVIMKTYRTTAGGFEFVVRFQFEPPGATPNPSAYHYLFDFRQPSGDTPDSSLFVSLLGGVKIA